MWEAMHGSMTGYFEVRTRGPKKSHIRLYCLLELAPPGLPGPVIAVITGLWKPDRTGFAEADYATVRELGDEYKKRSPRSVLV